MRHHPDPSTAFDGDVMRLLTNLSRSIMLLANSIQWVPCTYPVPKAGLSLQHKVLPAALSQVIPIPHPGFNGQKPSSFLEGDEQLSLKSKMALVTSSLARSSPRKGVSPMVFSPSSSQSLSSSLIIFKLFIKLSLLISYIYIYCSYD